MRHTKSLRWIAVLLAFGVVAAACGDDASDAAAGTAAAEAAAAAAEAEAAAAQAEADAAAARAEEAADAAAAAQAALDEAMAAAEGTVAPEVVAELEAALEAAEAEAAAAEAEAAEAAARADEAAAAAAAAAAAEPASMEPESVAMDLSGVCPSPLVVQTDWFPESEHGAMYHLIGDDYVVDTDNQTVTGSMVLDGADLGIDFQVRTGGPAIGFAPVSSYMYTDESIHLGYASTDAQILQFADAPLVSVVAPLEQNPQMIMWDPETYPNVNSIADLGRDGITVNVFGGGVFPLVFVAQGIWSEDQVDPSYDGSPARFVAAGGEIAQQGFASAEPYQYLNTHTDWGKPVAFELLHDAGFQIYSQTIGVRPRDMESMRPCLERVVPIIQQAVVSYDASPDRANGIIVDAVAQYASFWTYSPGLAQFSVDQQRELGLIGNGPDSTVGNMEASRIQGVLDAILATDLAADVPDGLSVDDIHTNEFIDDSIGFAETMVAMDLSGVCPSPLVVQTDWFPESEHGAMYHLIGDDYVVDTDNQTVTGSMVLDGADLGIDFQVRTGGPAIGFAPVSSYMYTDESIHLGYASTDAQILQFADAPLVSVVAPLEQNPQMIMWDPETYPNVNSIADLGRDGITVNVFGGGVFPLVFVAQGIWSEDQVDPSYDGSPARFVAAGGEIAQQGFASAEPYQYLNTHTDWGKPVAFELLHDAGFQIYSQTIGVRPRDMESMRPCLERVVPIIQQAVVSYDASPDRANGIIVDAVAQYASFWTYSPGLAQFSVDQQRELGLIGNGPDSTVGNMEASRIQGVLDAILATDLADDVPDGLSVDDIHTNEFIDPSIGF
ncbi:MAG: hypothetical protein F4076_02845 [Acidimicrobiaceae bacterium]|nr:hypothetical protein [Acidimicrobiaceae bacterium]